MILSLEGLHLINRDLIFGVESCAKSRCWDSCSVRWHCSARVTMAITVTAWACDPGQVAASRATTLAMMIAAAGGMAATVIAAADINSREFTRLDRIWP